MVELEAKVEYEAATLNSYFTPVQANQTLSALLTSVNDRIVGYTVPDNGNILERAFEERCSSKLYGYSWHPDDQHYISIVKDSPILLRKFNHSQILGKYAVRNHTDEIRAPLAARFVEEGCYLLTAHSGNIQIFDTETTILTQSLPISKPSSEIYVRPKTILSAIAADSDLIAIGTYSGLVFTYDLRQNRAVNMLEGQTGGLIQCEIRNKILYTGGRVDPYIFAWDLRKPSAPKHLLTYVRKHRSHQRIIFDLTDYYLSVGNDDGSIYLYNLCTADLAYAMMAHFDSVNSAQMRSHHLVTSSGQRHSIISSSQNLSLIRILQLPL